jgi:hypothetical protein
LIGWASQGCLVDVFQAPRQAQQLFHFASTEQEWDLLRRLWPALRVIGRFNKITLANESGEEC